jgi:phosphate transport system permease protein
MRMNSLYPARRRRNLIWIVLAYAATAFGLFWLIWILGALIWKGVGGLSIDIFTKNPAAPGEPGGVLNGIVGSLMVTVIGLVIAAPIGILAGTYLAEYGRFTRTAQIVRFINDILLSAPSIVIGLFVYDFCVLPFQQYSAIAGGISLSILAMPIIVRTTEDMLNLVPNQLREAASALGMPRSLVIRQIAYKAAQAGIVTGILLAIARMSGETAPLIFTAFGNSQLSFNPVGPMASLPLQIYQYAGSAYPSDQKLAWAAALIVTTSVLALSILARVLSARVGNRK